MFKLFIAFCWLTSIVYGLSVHGLKTLVIYDPRNTKLENYSKFFNGLLTENGYELEFASVYNEQSDGSQETPIEIYKDDTRLYDNLIIFPLKGRVISNSKINAKILLDFSKDGGDILTITTPESLNDVVRVFLNQLGIHPSPRGYKLNDYFNRVSSKENAVSESLLSIPLDGISNQYVFNTTYDDNNQGNVIYEGSAALLGNGELLVPILPAPKTSFTVNNEGNEWSFGSQGYLIAGFQNLNNARISWAGSQTFFNDKNFENNKPLICELVKWTFREKSVIKSTGFSYEHIDGTSVEERPFKVKDSVIYEIGFSEWNGNEWVPFVTDDVQFELRMIDPYYRLTLSPTKDLITKNKDKNSQYYTTGEFSLPDHPGVYTLLTEYRRTGLSFVTERDVKPIRQLSHDEYPRSYEITNAWVYLTSLFSVIGLFVIFLTFYIQLSTSTNVAARPVTLQKKNK